MTIFGYRLNCNLDQRCFNLPVVASTEIWSLTMTCLLGEPKHFGFKLPRWMIVLLFGSVRVDLESVIPALVLSI